VHIAVGMPANERMDWLVEKATELGVASIQPLITERSVLRLSGERAAKKTAHWQAVAIAACEQCGRNRVPVLHPVADLAQWLRALPASAVPSVTAKALLSLSEDTVPLLQAFDRDLPVLLLVGPEGGLSPQEESSARTLGFQAVTLGPRVLRSETAPLAALAALAL
jgi:16S rRNA (uracil1498-N3)-methyltransferase